MKRRACNAASPCSTRVGRGITVLVCSRLSVSGTLRSSDVLLVSAVPIRLVEYKFTSFSAMQFTSSGEPGTPIPCMSWYNWASVHIFCREASDQRKHNLRKLSYFATWDLFDRCWVLMFPYFHSACRGQGFLNGCLYCILDGNDGRV